MGRNTLSFMAKVLCVLRLVLKIRKAIIALGQQGLTCLFNAGIPEQIIQKTTGHYSVSALLTYESN